MFAIGYVPATVGPRYLKSIAASIKLVKFCDTIQNSLSQKLIFHFKAILRDLVLWHIGRVCSIITIANAVVICKF